MVTLAERLDGSAVDDKVCAHDAFMIPPVRCELVGASLAVFAKHVVHPERSEMNGVATPPFGSEEAPDEAPS
jgi:hypothetical protein